MSSDFWSKQNCWNKKGVHETLSPQGSPPNPDPAAWTEPWWNKTPEKQQSEGKKKKTGKKKRYRKVTSDGAWAATKRRKHEEQERQQLKEDRRQDHHHHPCGCCDPHRHCSLSISLPLACVRLRKWWSEKQTHSRSILATRIVRGCFAFVGGRVNANNDASKIGANLFLIYPKLGLWIYVTFLFLRSLLFLGAKFCQIEKINFWKGIFFRNIDAISEIFCQISKKNKQKNISPHLNCAFSLVTVFKLVNFASHLVNSC